MVDGHMRQLTAEAARRRGEIAKLQEGLAGQNISVVIEGAGKLAKLQVALDELKQTMVRKAIEGTLVEILAPNPSNKIVKELNALFGIAKEIRNQYRRNSDMWKDLTRLLERICDLINLRHPVHQLRPPQAEAPPSQSGQPRGGRFCKSPGGSSSYGGSLCDQSLSHPYVRQGPSSWQQPVDANPDYPW
jgi:hypothetical protein